MNDQIRTEHFNSQNNLLSDKDYFNFETSLLSDSDLQYYSENLNIIALEYNPFEQNEIDPEDKSFLKKVGLLQFLNNPFTFTNKTLQLLDKLET